MREKTKEDCARLAAYLLAHPALSFQAACVELQVSRYTMNGYLQLLTPQEFLRTWGGEAATDDNIALVLSQGLRVKNGRAVRLQAKKANAALAKRPPQQGGRGYYLPAHKCQWLVNFAEQPYCGKTVVGLYCEEHERIAKRQETERFEESRRKDAGLSR